MIHSFIYSLGLYRTFTENLLNATPEMNIGDTVPLSSEVLDYNWGKRYKDTLQPNSRVQ